MPAYYKTKRQKIKITRTDFWYSRKIRLRDAYNNGYAKCCTCGVTKFWLEMQCGHFMTREKPATRFHDKNCHIQCCKCNGRNKGEQGKHGAYIDRVYGIGTAQMLIDISEIRGTKDHSEKELKELSGQFRAEAKAISKQKNIDL